MWNDNQHIVPAELNNRHKQSYFAKEKVTIIGDEISSLIHK